MQKQSLAFLFLIATMGGTTEPERTGLGSEKPDWMSSDD
jgi:hypothetical protein